MRTIKGAARKQRRKEGKIAVVMTEGISAINVVKGFAREAFEEERFAKQNNSSAEAGVVTTRLAANMDRLTQVLLALGTAVVLWYGVTRVRDGSISPGDLLVFTAYLSTLYKPVRKMASMTARVAATERSRSQQFMDQFNNGLDALLKMNLARAGLTLSSEGLPYIGGVSVSGKDAVNAGSDRVMPRFNRGQFRVAGTQRPSGSYSDDESS